SFPNHFSSRNCRQRLQSCSVKLHRVRQSSETRRPSGYRGMGNITSSPAPIACVPSPYPQRKIFELFANFVRWNAFSARRRFGSSSKKSQTQAGSRSSRTVPRREVHATPFSLLPKQGRGECYIAAAHVSRNSLLRGNSGGRILK